MSGEGGVPRLTNLAESMGMEITEFGEGLCVVELTVGQMHLNLGGIAHGGVHATLLDTAMGGTLISMMSKEEWSASNGRHARIIDFRGGVVRHSTTGHILPERCTPG